MKHEGLIRFGLVVCLFGILAVVVNADTIYPSLGQALKLGGTGDTVQIPSLKGKSVLGTDANGNLIEGSIAGISLNQQFTTVNITNKLWLFDNDITCYGTSCDVCEYFNGTHQIKESPCGI